jgi:hypothetical protein
VLEHYERDEGSVRGRQAAHRISYLCNDFELLHLPQRNVFRALRDIGTRKRGDECSVSTKAARQVTREIRCRYEKPGQYGAVNHPNRFPASPELKKRTSRDIFRVMDVRGHSESLAIHTVAMLIEDSDESIAVVSQNGRPGSRLVPIGFHH